MGWIALIFKPLEIWLESRSKKAQAKAELEIAVTNNRARLARDKETNNHDWEMANLTDKDKGLRYISYSIFALPILVTVVYPSQGQAIFTNLEYVPDWWVKTFVSINGGVWGIIELKRAAPALISAIKGAVRHG